MSSNVRNGKLEKRLRRKCVGRIFYGLQFIVIESIVTYMWMGYGNI